MLYIANTLLQMAFPLRYCCPSFAGCRGSSTKMWKYMLLVLINIGILLQLFPVTICDPEDYLNYSCIQKYGNYTKDSPYKANLKTLMSTISSDTRINYGFYNISVGQGPDKVNGKAVCRGDMTVQGCHQCLKDSTFALPFFCGAEKEAIIWYDNCTLWYSNRFIFGVKEEQPLFIQNDGYNVSDPYQFKEALSKLLSRLQIQAASGDSQLKFATGQAKVSDSGNVYGMSQCSPDLSRDTCLECLGDFSAKLLNCCAHTQAASVRGPSCLVRHDSSLFYNIPGASLPQPPASSNMPSSTKHGKGRHKRDTWIIVGTLFLLSMLLLTLVCWFSTRKRTLHKEVENPVKRAHLDWGTRCKIIHGIARGLLYLHEDSQLRVIHRDLKPRNILLSVGMDPKISNFCKASLVHADLTRGHTSTINGTFGYMAPEYALKGNFSLKSDIFSFGVILLEIISGQMITRFSDHEENEESLPIFAWRKWSEGKALDIVDQAMSNIQNHTYQITRCIQIALLCAQGNPTYRPMMSSVVLMLNSDTVPLPEPSKPGFMIQDELDQSLYHQSSQINKSHRGSVNEASISDFEPR